ncbi:hypothetical protein LTR36_000195 [Oleoguttula mirabilis]|uniref:Polycomb protein VEFS-Box domain-containing protein n=1 Tax=Oleoguttula mirabilis TaxID=1507867 RepID=A0AAV9JYE7_9PEZI|nr:hypothetical protein LTR36_000195 [Oleoguttula mirabilis]
MVANERRSAGWDYPTNEMLQDLVKGEKPVLQIDALQLRVLEVSGNNRWRIAQQAGDDDTLEWLPHPTDDLRLPCQVNVNVVDTPPSKRYIYTQSLQGTITRRQDTDGGHFYDITLNRPFLIELDKIFVATESGSNGSRHWKRTVTTKNSLEVAVKCRDSEDTAELLSALESREISKYDKAPASEGVMRATWADLPQCPPNGQLLPLRRAQGHKNLELHYGMDVSMGWARRKDSPLETYNRMRLVNGRQLPTPSASDDSEGVKKSQHVIRYSFQQGAQTFAFTQDDFSCIWCQSVAKDADRGSRGWYEKSALPCTSLDRLRLHYTLCHDHFRVEVGEIQSVDGRQLVPVALTLTDREASFADSEKPALEEYSWIAPQRPFDISTHVTGDDSWTGSSKSKPKRGPGRPSKVREETDPGAMPVPVVSRKRSALDEVRDLPAPKRKKYTVPAISDVTFYHSLSKQQVQPGEEHSESDDEMYDDRLIRSQRRNFTELGLSQTVCEFHQAFNLHLDAEQPSSATLIRDALVRFARKHQSKLWNDEWRHAFEEKLKHLEGHNVISADFVAFCLNRHFTDADERPQDESGAAGTGAQADYKKPDENDRAHDHSVTGDEPSRVSNGGGMLIKVNGDDTDSDLKPKGIFTKVTDSTPNESLPRSKKRHRWSGCGADRDIVAAGRALVPNGVDRQLSSASSIKVDAARAPSRAGTTPIVETARTGTPTPRFKWVDGQFVPRKEESETRLPATGLAKGIRASGMPNGHAFKEHAVNMLGDDEHELPSVAHRSIHYVRADASQRAGSSTGYAFIKESVGDKLPDDIVAADLDFGRFVKRLRRELAFDPGCETLVCRDGANLVNVTSERIWHQMLGSWEARKSLAPLVFEVLKEHQSPPAKVAVKQDATNGVSGATPDGHEREKQQSQSGRAALKKKKGVCICGKPAEGGRGCIACDNLVSEPQ